MKYGCDCPRCERERKTKLSELTILLIIILVAGIIGASFWKLFW